MSRTYQLRTYTLANEEAAIQYREIWFNHVESLSKVSIQTHGIFVPMDNPCQVVGLVSYSNEKTVEEWTREYMTSEGFKQDVNGFELSNMINVETREMTSIRGSPLQ